VRGDGVGYYALVRAPLIEHNSRIVWSFSDSSGVMPAVLNDSFRGAGRRGAADLGTAGRFAAGRVGDPPRQRAFNPNERDRPSQAIRKPVPYHPNWHKQRPR
jgi:hypothetical protein